MEKVTEHVGKCTCKMRIGAYWVVVRHMGSTSVVRCRACEQVWHTTADYARELPEELCSAFRWREILRLPGYHAREGEAVYA